MRIIETWSGVFLRFLLAALLPQPGIQAVSMLFPGGCSTFEPFRQRSAWWSSRVVCFLQSAPKVY